MKSCSPELIVKTSPQWELSRRENGSTRDIIDAILLADTEAGSFIMPEGVRKCLMGPTQYDTLRNVWAFVKKNVRYKIDRPGWEKVKSPGALFASGNGDCKSFSIAIGAILRTLGIRYKYRFTSYAPGDYTHVYIVAYPKGHTSVILDAVHTHFDEEVPYYRKRDYSPHEPVTGGIHGVHGSGLSVDPSGILITGLVAILIFNLFK